MTNNNGDNETRQFGRVTGENETRQFGAPQQQPPQRPQQHFPEPGSQNTQAYGQPYQQGYDQNYQQPQYDPVPSSYQVEQPKKGGGALSYVFAAIAAIAVVFAGVLFFLWRGAAADADKPAPEPVTETVTTEVPTTVTTTKSSPRDNLPTDIPTELPTELPPDVQDRVDQGGAELEGLINDLFEQFDSGMEELDTGGAGNA
ncbi:MULTISPECIES: hypothetical protein [unclassified Corynebacterium]|uniref:hypothetical protein n=1 Tax=unclassified Corynebacterium TaxID=2624378 RepID=UPI0008A239FC|nr:MULTISPECIES: hypothetical protein [unclassified Corynebacterium]MDK6806647.1 hypothetical protein [Corynebacterium aurimucosum]NJJ81925.1 hypothetical protein [Corynebacterium aurimucosum]OFK29339.1 hypothetical protein HMPREF2822_03480 [Corynebacterium sp. HMSC062E11]OFL58963.1 hypothetical protein HMPREF2760_05190 [Corynebacterium sp. HMSC065D07]OFM33081.1 hypothetical protein HMPREF2698_01350 [Corynebacterium sp. HMSC072A02]